MSAAYRLVVHETGGPDKIEREQLGRLEPAHDEVVIRNEAIGVNFIDVYHRTGLYPLPLPIGLGNEGVGIIESIGSGVSGVSVGQRVAYMATGAYATHVKTAAPLYIVPDDIASDIVAAVLLKGLTAWALIEKCAKVEAGQAVLVHAAAGGVGSILVPYLKHIGATVVAHAGTTEKAEIAKRLGADHALACSFEKLADEVRELTGGKGVRAVFDGVGAASWRASIASLGPRGLMVSFGNASGPVPPVSPRELATAGSLFLTRPTLVNYQDTSGERAKGSERLFSLIEQGVIKVDIGQRFPLEKAADAHRALEARQTIGSTILIP